MTTLTGNLTGRIRIWHQISDRK